jgi:hypothetical protein
MLVKEEMMNSLVYNRPEKRLSIMPIFVKTVSNKILIDIPRKMNSRRGYWVLKWDARREDKGKHGKFDKLWLVPFKVAAYRGSNAYLLEESNG